LSVSNLCPHFFPRKIGWRIDGTLFSRKPSGNFNARVFVGPRSAGSRDVVLSLPSNLMSND
jgi:hypothetical protein